MTRKKTKPQDLQLRPMNRNKIYAGLVMAGVLAIVFVSCNRDGSNDSIDVVFYQTAAQCEADVNSQHAEYAALMQKYQQGEEDEAPSLPPMEAKDCAAQIQAAQQEHLKTAPVYASLAECQAEGVQCEATATGEVTAGYRPAYGGTYLDPYNSSHVYVYYGSTPYRVYETRSVYLSSTPGRIITPYGREISQTTTGRVSAPRHTSFAPPSRPAGVSGSGTIRGRSSQGFGSTFKGTGFGGK
jgi:uncharacterized protein YgiB involved in biofilm formation